MKGWTTKQTATIILYSDNGFISGIWQRYTDCTKRKEAKPTCSHLATRAPNKMSETDCTIAAWRMKWWLTFTPVLMTHCCCSFLNSALSTNGTKLSDRGSSCAKIFRQQDNERKYSQQPRLYSVSSSWNEEILPYLRSSSRSFLLSSKWGIWVLCKRFKWLWT